MRGILVILLLLFCSSPQESREVKKVISLAPNVTEIIYALGREALLVGTTIWDDYPVAVKKKPKVGDFSNPSFERILKLKPDLVFATLPEQRLIIDRLKKLGVKVFISQPKGVENIFKEMEEIALILGAKERGDSLVKLLKEEVALVSKTPPPHRYRVYIELSVNPLVSVGGNSFLNEVIYISGGENIFKGIPQEYPMVSQEEVIKRDPEVIVILHPLKGIEEIRNRLGWENISAVKSNRIYSDINDDLLLRPGPRIVEGIKELSERLKR